MTNQLTQNLSSLFATTATDAEVPPLPLVAVVAQGRSLQQARRRRTAVWSAAAAAVAVVAVTVPLTIADHHRTDGPAPAHRTHPSPDATGIPTTPTTLPYLDGRDVHFGHRTVTVDPRPIRMISSGDTTIVWNPKSERWSRVWATDGTVEPFGAPWGGSRRPWQGWFQPTISSDGTKIAVLTHPTQNTSRITDYDAEGQEEIGHVDLDAAFANWTGGGDSVTVFAVNNSGRVYWNQAAKGGDGWWMWEPTMKAPVQLHVALDFGGAYPPNGALTEGGAAVTFASDGEPRPIPGLTDVDLRSARWSPDGTVLAVDGAAGPQIIRLDGDRQTHRPPPTDFTILQWLGFESDAYVVGAATVANEPSLIRCATDHSACTVIGKLPADWQRRSWATSPPD